MFRFCFNFYFQKYFTKEYLKHTQLDNKIMSIHTQSYI